MMTKICLGTHSCQNKCLGNLRCHIKRCQVCLWQRPTPIMMTKKALALLVVKTCLGTLSCQIKTYQVRLWEFSTHTLMATKVPGHSESLNNSLALFGVTSRKAKCVCESSLHLKWWQNALALSVVKTCLSTLSCHTKKCPVCPEGVLKPFLEKVFQSVL
mgnify:CR=1 FL=1